MILDFVPNHTSEQHPWFVESRSSRESAKRDWYIWRDPKPDGSPPNNWVSEFGGLGVDVGLAQQPVLLSRFLKEQPDLNWRSPAVRAAMLEVMRFWIKRGVEGFRVDAIATLTEDELLRNDPPNPAVRQEAPPDQRVHRAFSFDRPDTHDYVADMRAVIDEFPDRVLIGEAHLPVARVKK